MSWPGARRSYGASRAAPVAPGAVASQPAGDGDQVFAGDVVAGPSPLNAPSGYQQLIGAWTAPPPVLVAHDPAVGQFVPVVDIGARALGVGPNFSAYVPAYASSGIVGGFSTGSGAIGHRVPYHGTLIAVTVDGFEVWEPATPNDGPLR